MQNNFSNFSMPGRSPYFHAISQQEQRHRVKEQPSDSVAYTVLCYAFFNVIFLFQVKGK